jgi:RecB family exonuclease
LTPQERGSLAHLALAAFWRRVRDRRALLALDPPTLAATIEDAVLEAMQASTIGPQRWASLPAVLAPAERERLCGLLGAWLERAERGRPDFVVSEIESPIALELEGFRINARLDRVDVLADGSVAIVDYKTGTTAAFGRWFDPRPLAPQLAVYLLARRAANPQERIGALAYAQLAPDALEWVGIAADAERFPPLRTVADATGDAIADWPAAEAAWRAAITALAAETAAAAAGLQAGDVVLRYGEARIFAPDDLVTETRGGTAGEVVRVEVLRQGQRLEVDVPRGPLGVRIAVSQGSPGEG